MTAPVIGIACCRWTLEKDRPFHLADDDTLAAVRVAGGLPLLLPALGGALSHADLLPRLDGLLLPGSLSNIDPRRYGDEATPDDFIDPERDATTLALIRAAVDAGVPLFGVCRGMQEINVAYGGTLCRAVHEAPGRLDHREPAGDMATIYRPAHPVSLAHGGWLRRLSGLASVTVNSLHHQGVERLGQGLAVEALAPDGLIEALRVIGARRFAIGVQWHPEWALDERPLSRPLFDAFIAACRQRRTERTARLAVSIRREPVPA
ncbi:gamma-glutamyl-gamma-aminobutyrate hydrolase family protein [Crenobacter cavernae]|uniref:Gamma-glutamyl-gamma-aminobutyrate hydrolase family protein n=1 Tax=Crenobacter cavernae TaxID=2290923 RepID=A0ABY0FFX4_9NEIS|nr:gamma-glutamyl-gamma-aminobutyrate hydrolase family protein [Crenobacter cavernae]RXZ45286.1 gamma-glutamyl-gamma-aminobutyrate hydrolase family protein [Crenobacter cavernae]